MAKLRPACAYRAIKQAYTRKSKYRKHNFVRGIPGSKVVMYDMGNKVTKFPNSVTLVSKKDINLRHNAIESARMTANRYLEVTIGKDAYGMKIKVVPHNIMRENPLATGAGADRLQRGMTLAFGKPIGFSAHVKEGKELIQVSVNKEHLSVAKEALRKAASKFPMQCSYREI